MRPLSPNLMGYIFVTRNNPLLWTIVRMNIHLTHHPMKIATQPQGWVAIVLLDRESLLQYEAHEANEEG